MEKFTPMKWVWLILTFVGLLVSSCVALGRATHRWFDHARVCVLMENSPACSDVRWENGQLQLPWYVRIYDKIS
jgi:hypothetical protein